MRDYLSDYKKDRMNFNINLMNLNQKNTTQNLLFKAYKLVSILAILLITPYLQPAAYAEEFELMQKNSQEGSYIIKGVVVDNNNDPIIGANITIEGTSIGTTTDIDGNYQLVLSKPNVNVIFSFIGYQTQSVHFKGANYNDFRIITLIEDSKILDDVTVVAFAKQKKESVLASISTVKPGELKVPSSNLTTALAGRIAGVISYQRSGEPGQDNADFFVRGVTTFGYAKSPLILIDGIEMSSNDLARLNTDDIASFSIMKDANATAVYGARGANGVIYVKTKEGAEGKTVVNFRAEGSISQNSQNIELADNVTYMRMWNEATANRDPFASAPFSTKKIEMTEKGIDPILYPSVNWQDVLFKNQTFNQRYNINISGGGAKARYYIAGQFNTDNGILKSDNANDFNSNIRINRYLLRSNTTMNFTKRTVATVRLHASFEDYNGPLDSGTDIFNSSLHASPVHFLPFYERDESHKYTKNVLFGNYEKDALYNNPYARMVRGYKETKSSTIMAQVDLEQDLDFITKGLKARIMGNVNRYSYFGAGREFKPFYYQAARTDEGEYRLLDLNETTGQNYLNYSDTGKDVTSTLYFEGQTMYQRKFKELHDVSGMLVFIARDFLKPSDNLQKSLPARNLGLSGRFTYGYDTKYFVEANFGYNGSERFDKNNRFGFFPAMGLGYLISNESFYPSNLRTVLDNVKLKYTWGKVGSDNIGDENDRFFYLSEVNPSNNDRGYTFGSDFGYYRSGVSISRYADPHITWEVATKQNIGIEMNLFQKIQFQADYFWEKRDNILMARTNIPSWMGLWVTPKANVGKATGEGFEWSVDVNHAFNKDMWIQGRANFTYAVGRFEEYEEPDYSQTPWRARKGQKLSQTWGYVAERLFIDQYEVDNSPKQTFSSYGPGDIKYKDINGDFVIDEKDEVPIGYPTSPEIIYGFGLSYGYKGLDMSCFFQGSARSSFWIDAGKTAPFLGDKAPTALLKVWADDYWSTSNQNSYAKWPRLSDQRVANNTVTSTWFMRDGTFLRLKEIEVGYSLPDRWIKKAKMEKLRLYVQGYNLFCWSKFDLWDPEMAGNGLGYPIQRVYNFGLNLTF